MGILVAIVSRRDTRYTLCGVAAATFFLIQIPLTFAAVLGGYFFILKKIKKGAPENQGDVTPEFTNIFSALGPIGILVIISVLGSAVLPKIGLTGTLSSLLSMLIGFDPCDCPCVFGKFIGVDILPRHAQIHRYMADGAACHQYPRLFGDN